MSRKIIPTRDAEFNDFQLTVVAYLISRAAALSLLPAKMTALGIIQTDWNTVWAIYIDPVTRTKAIIFRKKVTKKEFTSQLRVLIQDAKRSPALNADDIAALNLPDPAEPRTPVKRPSETPDVEVRKVSHLLHTLSITNPLKPDSRAKPDGVAFIEVYKSLSETEPETIAYYHLAGIASKTMFTVEHAMDEVLKMAWYICRYVNSKGEAGPWSAAVNAGIM